MEWSKPANKDQSGPVGGGKPIKEIETSAREAEC